MPKLAEKELCTGCTARISCFSAITKGESFWHEIRDKVIYKEVTLEQASQENPSMSISSKANPNRDSILDKIREGHIAECENLFVLPKVFMSSRIKGKIKRLLHIG